MSIHYALAGWSGNRERRDERTKRKREKEKDGRRDPVAVGSLTIPRWIILANMSNDRRYSPGDVWRCRVIIINNQPRIFGTYPRSQFQKALKS
ncbi:hypothetical protein EVAR_47319_1 [Eumeta japonica]|uniref:Uncharacterized protein n=1 Tax=Eumeta variegata TaxID=151549 RepID=A0A4C1YKA8_EUMVA|nr:hypothetical protein EVAR_47319_1 [Eumeta japonica]